MNPDSGIKTWQWVVTIVVIIALIVIGVMVFGNKGTDTTDDMTIPTGTNNTTQGMNSIVIADQYPGDVVYVSSVQIQAPGWVAILKDSSGMPGAIIGTAYVPAGISPAKVTVTQPIVDTGTYYAVLYSDNGDKSFDATTDLPLKDASGNIIMRVFKGSVAAGSNIKG